MTDPPFAKPTYPSETQSVEPVTLKKIPICRKEPDVHDPNFVMDCDFDGEEENLKEKTQREIVESTRRGSRRRKSRFAQVTSLVIKFNNSITLKEHLLKRT